MSSVSSEWTLRTRTRIFAALLGKQFGVRTIGWREATGYDGVDGSFRSVAGVVDDASLRKFHALKKEPRAAANTRR